MDVLNAFWKVRLMGRIMLLLLLLLLLLNYFVTFVPHEKRRLCLTSAVVPHFGNIMRRLCLRSDVCASEVTFVPQH